MSELSISLLHDNEPTTVSQSTILNNILDNVYKLRINNITIPFSDRQAKAFDNIIAVTYRRNDFYNDVFKSNSSFVTWVQDEIDWFYDKKSMDIWNNLPNDWIIGYTDRLTALGYRTDRLIEMPMLRAIPSDLKPIRECDKVDVVFAGNKGIVPEEYALKVLFPICKQYGIPFPLVLKAISHMRNYYEAGNKICGYQALNDFLMQECPHFTYLICDKLPQSLMQNVMNIYFYWGINEALYRQTVLKWCIDLGLSIKIAGYDWYDNKVFSKYCVGYVNNRDVYNFYRQGRYALHLNSFESYHHRPTEILMSGSNLLMRRSCINNKIESEFSMTNYIDKQTELIDYILCRIYNKDESINKPDTSILYDTFKYAVNFNSKEELANLFNES